MSLIFPGKWRYKPPINDQYITERIPDNAITDFIKIITSVATQGKRQELLEHYKGYFCRACGTAHFFSTDEGWSETDLCTFARQAAENAPLFIEAFYDASQSLNIDGSSSFVPDVEIINNILAQHKIGYSINPPRLELMPSDEKIIPIDEPSKTINDQAIEKIAQSLSRSVELLHAGKPSEAVQKSLWILETFSTAFKGLKVNSRTITGKYFNTIITEMKNANPNTSSNIIMSWMSQMHGYLSSTTGGGVRHGADINEVTELNRNEAQLFCNLISSYLNYLINEHKRLVEN